MADVTDPSMKVRIEGDSTPLEKTLKEAEKKVDQSGKDMGSKVEKNLTEVANKLGSKIAKMIGAGFAIKALDDSLKIIAAGIRQGKGAEDIALAIGDSILEGLRRVPVAGALGDILAMVFDPLLGDPQAVAEAREKYAGQQAKEKERQRLLRDIAGVQADPMTEADLRMQKDIDRINELEERALSSLVKTRRFMQKEFEAAVEKAAREYDPDAFARNDPRRILNARDFARQNLVKRAEFETAPELTADALAEQSRIRTEAEAARQRVRDEAARRAAKVEAPSPAGEAKLPDIVPPDVDVEEAVEDMHESIVDQGNESVFSDTKMIGLATDTLAEIKELRKIADRFVTANIGLR